MKTQAAVRHVLLGAIALVALASLGGTAVAQQKLVLKASDVHPAGYPTVVAVENIGKKLAAATNGRIIVQMFAAMQLGGEKEAIEQAQIGAIQFARGRGGALGPGLDGRNALKLPVLARS